MSEKTADPRTSTTTELEKVAMCCGALPFTQVVIRAVKRSPVVLVCLPWWRLRGTAVFRRSLAGWAGISTAEARNMAGDAPPAGLALRDLLSALRVQQWSKNLLVAVPALAGQRLLEPGVPLRLAGLFAAFSFCASAIYLLNDLADIDADRRHPIKRFRPVARGLLSPAIALSLSAVLALAGILIAAVAIRPAVWLLATYLIAGAMYSLYWKPFALIDVFVLVVLYLLRLAAGHFVSDIALSPWLFALAFFLLLSLALCKRTSELMYAPPEATAADSGHGYQPVDLDILKLLGCASGVCSALVLAIYTQSRHVHSLYAEPAFLLLGSPLLLVWICRIWLLAQRGLLHGDPLSFAMRDRFSYITLICGLLLLLFARTGWIHMPMIG